MIRIRLIAGLGFRRDADWQAMTRAVQLALAEYDFQVLVAVATLADKAASPAIQQFCQHHRLPLHAISATSIRTQLQPLGASAAQQHLGLPGVAEPCALLAAGPGGRLWRSKCSLDGVSVALAELAADDGLRDGADRGSAG